MLTCSINIVEFISKNVLIIQRELIDFNYYIWRFFCNKNCGIIFRQHHSLYFYLIIFHSSLSLSSIMLYLKDLEYFTLFVIHQHNKLRSKLIKLKSLSWAPLVTILIILRNFLFLIYYVIALRSKSYYKVKSNRDLSDFLLLIKACNDLNLWLMVLTINSCHLIISYNYTSMF